MLCVASSMVHHRPAPWSCLQERKAVRAFYRTCQRIESFPPIRSDFRLVQSPLRNLGWLLLAFALLAPFARAQPGDELSAYLITIGPGDEIFEKFGHNLIRITDESTGQDIVYNWGVFDFDQPHFVLNFAMGRPRYWMRSDPTEGLAEFYKSQDRQIRLQQLNLSAAQNCASAIYAATTTPTPTASTPTTLSPTTVPPAFVT